jgi:putative spermidine/putrescine transport system permease protein
VFLAYVYFQVPLMILVISPAIDGLKPEWREAAESLGASGRTYWLKVGLPVLAPSMLGAMVLLFGNAVAAQATAYALTGGGYNLVTNEITNVMNGNVLSDPHAGHALALGLVLIIVLAMLVYLPLQRRAARWMR